METARVAIIHRDIYIYPDKDSVIAVCKKDKRKVKDTEYNNHIFEMIKEGLHILGLDDNRYNSSQWNPLGKYITPGDTVLLKPNLVMDHNPNGGNTDCLYTHPSVVAAVIEFVLVALEGKGKIIVGDAPMQECNFERLISESGYRDIISCFQQDSGDVEIVLKDFRELKTDVVDNIYHQHVSVDQKGIEVRLDADSEFWGMDADVFRRLRVTNYDPDMMYKHHNPERCEYYISKDVLDSDVIINLPKPKTHRKAGVTIALKNLVGINARKEYLPHHAVGSKTENGDEYLNALWLKRVRSQLLDIKNRLNSQNKFKTVKIINFFIRCFSFTSRKIEKDNYREGSWYGNDTISKTIVDLNKIILYADKSGTMKKERQRKYLAIGDMIVSGEGEGPVEPSPKDVGIIAISDDPVAFDSVVATIMGADLEKIPTIKHASRPKGKYALTSCDNIEVVSNDNRWDYLDINDPEKEALLYYKPTSGWTSAFKNKAE